MEPVKLLYKVNAWYLKGFCLTKNAERTFKISRMVNLLNTGEGFTVRPDKAEETSTESTQLWIKIQLKIASNSTYRIYEEFNEKDITRNQDGSFGISTLLPDNRWLMSYLLSFGGDVIVLAPQHLRNKLREQSAKIFEHYS